MNIKNVCLFISVASFFCLNAYSEPQKHLPSTPPPPTEKEAPVETPAEHQPNEEEAAKKEWAEKKALGKKIKKKDRS